MDRYKAWWLFLSGYIQQPGRIGSIAPDSRHCVEALLRHAGLDSARVIIEFGSANGTVTRAILARKRQDARLVCVEMHPPFANRLRQHIARTDCDIVMHDVFKAGTALKQCGIADRGVDCIVSTLPCSNIPFGRLLSERVVPYLRPTGVFVQYLHVLSYLRGVFPRRRLERHFGRVTTEFAPLNIPPVVVYTCRGPRYRSFEPVAGEYDQELAFGELL